MIRGVYVATTGLLNSQRNIDVAGNNITNCQTTGFKKDALVSGSFEESLSYKLINGESTAIGGVSNGVTQAELYTSYEQGSLKQTDQNSDLAILGQGFFTLDGGSGRDFLTRDGHFLVNEQGFLSDTEGNLVLGTNGPINTGGADFQVNAAGEVIVNDQSVDTLRITCPADITTLVKVGENKYTSDNGATELFNGSLKQGYLEGANVDMVAEMAVLMEYSRSYQSCGQMIKMMDKIMEKTVNNIGSL